MVDFVFVFIVWCACVPLEKIEKRIFFFLRNAFGLEFLNGNYLFFLGFLVSEVLVDLNKSNS